MNNTVESKRISWLKEPALVVAGIPVLAYVLTFSYEFGSVAYYHIPVEFIRISIVDIFNIGIKIIFGCMLFYSLVSFIANLKPRSRASNYSLYLWASTFLILCLVMDQGIISKNSLYFLLPLLTILLILEYFYEVPSKYSLNKKPSTSANGQSITLDGYFGLLLLIIFCLGVVYGFGYFQSKYKVEYLVVNNEHVVVKIYEDIVILSPFDRKLKIIEGSLIIQKVADSKITFNMENVGPLNVTKNYTRVP